MPTTSIDDATRLTRATDVRFRRVRERLMLILETQVFELNETAEFAWILAGGDKPFREIVEAVADAYDAPSDVIRADLRELFGQLLDKNALEVV
jgi:pyrroloquinoline quinone biosynthesis protein D